MLELENNSEQILEGEIVTPQKRQRLFGNLSALLDYCHVFNIENAAFGKTVHNETYVFILEYYSNED